MELASNGEYPRPGDSHNRLILTSPTVNPKHQYGVTIEFRQQVTQLRGHLVIGCRSFLVRIVVPARQHKDIVEDSKLLDS
jgi:hypothetical protein